MLRECRRVLKPGRSGRRVRHPHAGRPHPGTGPARGPPLARPTSPPPASPVALTEAARLTVVVTDDVTQAFRATCAALRAARRDLEDELRVDEGDDFYEEEGRKKDAMLLGIDEGLLCRSLIMANK